VIDVCVRDLLTAAVAAAVTAAASASFVSVSVAILLAIVAVGVVVEERQSGFSGPRSRSIPPDLNE
jgi:hypothetical protein